MFSDTFPTNYILLFLIHGYVFGITFHHLVLYAFTRERSNLYQAAYAFTLLLSIIAFTDSALHSWNGPDSLISTFWKTVFLTAYHIVLILFTLHINNIRTLSLKLFKASLLGTFLAIGGLLMLMDGPWGVLTGWTTSTLLFSFVIWLTVYAMRHKVAISSQYLWTVIPLYVAVILHHGMCFKFYFFEDFCALLIAAALWNISAISVVLTAKVRALKTENDRISFENAVYEANMYLQARNAAMGELVADVAHQWKQPLNAIGTIQNTLIASAISGNISKEQVLEAAHDSFELLDHLNRTIDTFYRFLTSDQARNEIIDIVEQFHAIHQLTEYTFRNSHINLRFYCKAQSTIHGNRNEFIHALLNLILNAKEALEQTRPPSPLIEVTLTETPTECKIVISDNAGGIKSIPIESIFKRYVTTKQDGTGLGLSMAKDIISKRFNGTLTAENSQEGACFTISLPK